MTREYLSTGHSHTRRHSLAAAPDGGPASSGPVRLTDTMLYLQRTVGNQATTDLLRSSGAGPAIHRGARPDLDPRAIQRADLTVAPTVRQDVGEAMQAAWTALQQVAAQGATPEEIERIAAIAGEQGTASLHVPMLQRIENQKNTTLKIVGNNAPVKDPGAAGGTSCTAAYNEDKEIDVGFDAVNRFTSFLRRPPNLEERNKVTFVITIKLLIPKYEHQAKGGKYPGIGYFFETLNHELAIHAEKYADLIQDYQTGEGDWRTTFERQEHWEHTFEGNPRYMLVAKRVQQAAAQGEMIAGQPAALLWEGLKQELGESKKVYVEEEGMKPKLGGKTALQWLEELAEK